MVAPMDEVTLPELPRPSLHLPDPRDVIVELPYFTEEQVRADRIAVARVVLEHAAKMADALSAGVWNETCSGRAALDHAASAIRGVRVPGEVK